jgi:ribonuclease T2
MGARVWLVAIVMSVACGWVAGCKQPGTSPSSRSLHRDDPQAPYAEGRRSGTDGGRERGRGRSQRHGRAQAEATAGTFDFYLLALSWSPEFCVTHPKAAECAAHAGFVLHGLWPQNLDGSYPEDCSNSAGPGDPQAYRDILPDVHLLEHEWQTHGTCSGLSPDVYFGEARQAVREVVVPRDLRAVSSELQLTPQQILGEFAHANPGFAQGSFALSCGNNRLTAVEVCLTKDLKATSCSGVRSCRANMVKVTPPA